jgi:hypothetical protein
MPTDSTIARQALAIVQRAGEPQLLGELDGETYVEIPALVARLGGDGSSVEKEDATGDAGTQPGVAP